MPGLAVEATGHPTSGDDGLMPLFCPTDQANFAKSVSFATKSLMSLSPATVHGITGDSALY
jgi:hypothetical protein